MNENTNTILGILDRAVGKDGIRTDFRLKIMLEVSPDTYWKSGLTIVLVGFILKALSLLLSNAFEK